MVSMYVPACGFVLIHGALEGRKMSLAKTNTSLNATHATPRERAPSGLHRHSNRRSGAGRAQVATTWRLWSEERPHS